MEEKKIKIETLEKIKEEIIMERFVDSEELYSEGATYIDAYNEGIEKVIDIINEKLVELSKLTK